MNFIYHNCVIMLVRTVFSLTTLFIEKGGIYFRISSINPFFKHLDESLE